MTTVDTNATLPPVVLHTRKRTYSTSWWGMITLITTESMIFVILLGTYFFLRASAPAWPLGGIKAPELLIATPFSFVLWGSSVPIFYAEAAIRRNSQRGLKAGLAASAAMGLAFLGYTAWDFHGLTFGWRDNAYGSIYYLVVGLHALHVFIGLCMNAIVQIKAWQKKFSPEHHTTVEVFGLYWHFVDAVWIFVFGSLFLSEALR